MSSSVAFGDFVEHLRRHGFVVGLDHYARMMTVLERLGPESTPAQLKTMLCPLFATTAERQARFYQEFDRFYPVFHAEPPRTPSDATPDDGAAIVPPRRRRNRVLALVGGAAAVAALGIGGWLANRPDPVTLPEPTPAVAPLPLDTQSASPIQVAPPAPIAEAPSFLEQYRDAIRFGGIAGLLLLFIVWEWRAYRARRVVLERQRRARPPLVWPVRVDAVASPFRETPDFYVAARRLRDREAGDRHTLDIDATIAATVRALGFPTMRYAAVTRPPEYLVLIERSSRQDHQASLYRQLAIDLAGEGVHTVEYFYDDDPRACVPADGGPAVTLSELRRKYSAHRVLVFGTGDGFIDPITGALAPWAVDGFGWTDRVLLTPAIATRWGPREFTLASLFVVLPATVGGLLAAVDRIQDAGRPVHRRSRRVTGSEYSANLSDTDWLPRLREHLGDAAFRWVCACAVYPELQWRLTLLLGTLPELGTRALDEETVLKVARLPWFRSGVIPDEARQVLIRQLSPDAERTVRMALIDLLERNPAPAESIASSGYELDLVVQKLVVDGANRRRRRELLRAVQYAPRDRAARELAVLRLAEGEPSSGLAMRLPGRLRNVFFRRGLPVFGLTTGARAAAMVLAQASLLVAVGRSAKPPLDVQTANVEAAGQPVAVSTSDPVTPVTTATAPSATGERLLFPAGIRLGVGETTRVAVAVVGPRGDTLRDRAITFSTRDAGKVDILGDGRIIGRGQGMTQLEARSGDLVATTLALVESRAGAQLRRAIQLYEQFNIVAAQGILDDLIAPGRYRLTRAEETEIHTYLGSIYAVRAMHDSAVAHYRIALTLRPDLKLDSTRSAAVELRTLDVARRSLAAEATPLPFPGGVQENLDRAKQLFEMSSVEAARRVFEQLVSTSREVTIPQRVEIFKYLGAIHALSNRTDSAANYFMSAIDYDPFVELDRSVFAMDEQTAFARARASIFKRGIQPMPLAILVRGPTPVFRIVTTRPTSVRLELRSLGDNRLQDVLFTSQSTEGVRDILWSGLINAAPADSGRYFLRLVGSSVSGRGTDSTTATFGVLCRPEAGRPICALGTADFPTLRVLLDNPPPAGIAPAPSRPSVDSLLRQGLSAFNNGNYAGAATTVRPVFSAPGATPQQISTAYQITVASFYPRERQSQIRDFAADMILAWESAVGPDAVIDRNLSWPGLDSLITEVRGRRRSAGAGSRPPVPLLVPQPLIDSVTRALSGDWRSPDKVPQIEFSSPALARAFANQLREYQTRAAISQVIMGTENGDTTTFTASASFTWRDAFGVQRSKTARMRWVFVCNRSHTQCELRRVVFLDPVP